MIRVRFFVPEDTPDGVAFPTHFDRELPWHPKVGQMVVLPEGDMHPVQVARLHLDPIPWVEVRLGWRVP